MPRQISEEELIVQYLLGELSEVERADLQERIFSDDEFFTRMRAVENDLIDSYVHGELPPRRHELLEARMADSPRLQQEIEFAKALAKAAGGTPAPTAEVEEKHKDRGRFLAFFFLPQNRAAQLWVAATLILAVGSAWLMWEASRLRMQLKQLQTEHQGLIQHARQLEQQIAEQPIRDEALKKQPPPEQGRQTLAWKEKDARQPALSMLSFILSPGVIRGGEEPKKLSIPLPARPLKLQLNLDGEEGYKSFNAVLRTTTGKEVLRQDGLIPHSMRWGKAVVLNLSPEVLTPGEYEIQLRGSTSKGALEDVNYYYFSVVRK